MSKRRARRQIPLHPTDAQIAALGGTVPKQLPWPLGSIEWADAPLPDLPTQALEWIASKIDERGRYNVWECEVCGADFLCYDRHPGATPMTVAHRTLDPSTECMGATVSTFYNAGRARLALVDHGGPSHEWYRPSDVELKKAAGHTKDHVKQGGLLVRKVAA